LSGFGGAAFFSNRDDLSGTVSAFSGTSSAISVTLSAFSGTLSTTISGTFAARALEALTPNFGALLGSWFG
jgi:hypothetical protein